VKVHINGDTPMGRLTNFTKKIVAVPKAEVNALDKKWRSQKRKRRKK
jgi:hypothetical protein